MPIPISQLASEIVPENTVLFFGAGSSVPSKAPTVERIKKQIASAFKLDADAYSLTELAGIAEEKSKSRKRLIAELRKLFVDLRPTGGLGNVALYEWKSLFTTNYDQLIETSYHDRARELKAYSSNFDFTIYEKPRATKLFKIHGTIEKDVSDDSNSRIILTDTDYDLTQEYRDQLYNRLRSDLAGSHLVIIGHSLADQDIKDVITQASKTNVQTMGGGRITLLLYTADPDRALLYEKRGIEVCFGGIDEFFAELARRQARVTPPEANGKILDSFPELKAVTIEVDHASNPRDADVSAMFNGRPASFADIAASLTFQRSKASEIEDFLVSDGTLAAIVTGASGVGKTTLARQVLNKALARGWECWEHNSDQPLVAGDWVGIAAALEKDGKEGILLIDDAHSHLGPINDLVDRLVAEDTAHLKLVLTSSRNRWAPRIKSPNLFRFGREWLISQLTTEEVERLLQLIEKNDRIRPLVEESFEGFSRNERRRRLTERCEKDFFVCLKNIFASESIDDIILREFATIQEPYEDIYRHVAAMEFAGIRVHRQLVIRLLGISAQSIPAALDHLTDIVQEYVVDAKEGVYGWKCRHLVIASIVAKYKFFDMKKTIDLFDKVINCISPTFDIEIRTIGNSAILIRAFHAFPTRKFRTVFSGR